MRAAHGGQSLRRHQDLSDLWLARAIARAAELGLPISSHPHGEVAPGRSVTWHFALRIAAPGAHRVRLELIHELRA